MKRILFVLIVAVLGLYGCGSTAKETRSGQTTTAYEQVFEASKQSAPENHFLITKSDLATGEIVGRKGAPPTAVYLGIIVTKGTPNKVEVFVESPAHTKEMAKVIVQDVITSIKTRVPNLKVKE